ncbi:putative protein [Peptoniphilus sp. ING2-D1G]|nr:putative protein [Peptoniphilus sp. ING2-D1G]
MKKNFYRLSILALIFAICAVILFFILDYKNVTEKYGSLGEAIKDNRAVFVLEHFIDLPFGSDNLNVNVFEDFEKNKVISKNEKFNAIDLNFTNVEISVKKAENYEIILASDRDVNLSKTANIDKKDGEFNIKQGNNKYRCGVIIKTPDPQKLKIKLKAVNGGFVSDYALESFEADIVNGGLILSSENSFPIKINNENGLINLELSDYDANIEVKNVNGPVSIFGEDSINVGKDNVIEKVINNGRDKILINNINGVINIK